MTQETDRQTDGLERETRRAVGNMLTVEVCFVAILLAIIVAAFFEALTYKLVSSRTPFVIMVPLLILLLVQMGRLLKVHSLASTVTRARSALAGEIPVFSKIVAMMVWLTALMVAIIAFGHYIAIGAFIFVMTRVLAGERLKLAIITSVAMTAVILVVFEFGFDIELYRGLIYRYFMGYRVF